MLAEPEQWSALLKRDELRHLEACQRDAAGVADVVDSLSAQGIGLCGLGDADYPELLREISDPPPLLYYRGQLDICEKPMLAVVGSRRPTQSGLRDAEAFGRALGEAGFCIVSGLALGVDGAAHRGALSAGASTVAVLGCGVDVVYPRRHAALYQEVVEGGLMLSEVAPGTAPLRHLFPRRNRIISGMSLGVLVVEAAVQSGSLITARQAMEQNREVFALPGSLHNPASRGCNALIRQGAKLVETVADIVEEFSGWTLAASVAAAPDGASHPPLGNPVYQLLAYEPQSLDSLAARSGLPVTQLMGALAELELDGWAEQRGAAWLRCR
jgi:DNA processing protein